MVPDKMLEFLVGVDFEFFKELFYLRMKANWLG